VVVVDAHTLPYVDERTQKSLFEDFSVLDLGDLKHLYGI